MRFGLSFDMDGAAFDGGDNSVDEAVRILRTLADNLDALGAVDVFRFGFLRDVNGNTVGEWEVTEDQD